MFNVGVVLSNFSLGSNNRSLRAPPKEEDRYAFTASYYDTQADLMRQYQLTFFTIDNSIEMRAEYPKLSLKDLYIGALVNIHSRQLKIEGYADDFTANKLNSQAEITLAMIKPDGYYHIGDIIAEIYKAEFRINKMKMVHLTKQQAEEFYAVHYGKPFYNNLVDFMSSGRIVALELSKPDAIQAWRNLIGPTNFEVARREKPNSIRGKFASDGTRNAVHGSDSSENAKIVESNFFFGRNSFKPVALFDNSTLGIVKPHAVNAGSAGSILSQVQKYNFDITALQMFTLDKVNSADFFEVYKGVVPEYLNMVEELCSSPCIAFEVVKDENAVEDFRSLCGPADPELARVLRPNTIRAQFGQDKIKNAVHCTDLEEDGVLEVEFFFNIMQS
ncbi:nucleoside-diphosphate kinase [Acrasis kona]|uniref:Nucleoside-diphosphate kinase n=1 Tax=Acrasis kona TaxID=1008807 RepID=A0AAW2YZU2_9EUKA